MNLKVGDKVMFHNQNHALNIGGFYLTAGKEYEVVFVDPKSINGTGFEIRCDDGELTYCRFEGCGHLRLNPWSKVGEERLVESIANLIKSTLDAATVNN